MLDIDLTYCPVVNFAMQQNHVPVIRKLLIKNENTEEIDNIRIVIMFSPLLTDTTERAIDRIPNESSIEIKDLQPIISVKYLSELTEKVQFQRQGQLLDIVQRNIHPGPFYLTDEGAVQLRNKAELFLG